ncbi:MAG TPA: hypothetical protein VFF80_06085 [Bacillota bacterium]|nr:hypothetical protein [Bacillota bacterium]
MKILKIQLETLESMDYFWAALKDREKVADQFIQDVTAMEGYRLSYDQEFTAESVRRVMSALTNHEPFKASNKKEGRLYSNHLWMMDDLGHERAMLLPVKQLNLDYIKEELADKIAFDDVVVHFVPLHLDVTLCNKNHLLVNFFKVQPGDEETPTMIQEKPLDEFIKEALLAAMAK